MTRRTVHGLISAGQTERPPFIPENRIKRGPALLGIKYEQELARQLPQAFGGVWWEYEDVNGRGWCQTDFLLRGAYTDLILEAKHSYTHDAWTQLERIYCPVVGHALRRPTLGIQVCKKINTGVGSGVGVATDLITAIEYAKRGQRAVLHWINAKYSPPLVPTQRLAA